MKQLINELKMEGLTPKEKAMAWYFAVSLCLLLSIADNSSLLAIILVAVNFCIAALLVKKVPFSKIKRACAQSV